MAVCPLAGQVARERNEVRENTFDLEPAGLNAKK
jgi:hypothetical protein